MQPQEEPEGSHFHRVGGCGGTGGNCRQSLESSPNEEISVLAFGRFAAVNLIKNEHGNLGTPLKPLDVGETFDGDPFTVRGIAGADLFVVDGVTTHPEVFGCSDP